MIQVLGDKLVFSFPQIHPGAKCSIHMQRTLRLPDDGKTHRLPPGLGHFPVLNVDTIAKDKLPEDFATRGGVVFPMYQSEAMWVRFEGCSVSNQGTYPFAIKVSAGKRSAVTGGPWTEGLVKDDYCVIPKQPWLDGFCVEKGTIRQFVAAPLGMGVTVEEQVTGKAEFGGLQIEVFPMKKEAFERRFPVKRPLADDYRDYEGGFKCGGSLESMSLDRSRLGGETRSMGLGAGGKMSQTVYADDFGLEDWETTASEKVFVHIANSLLWRKLTGMEPPTTPRDANDYTRHGLPWFDFYAEGAAIGGGDTLAKVKPAQAFPGVVPDNDPLDVPASQVTMLSDKSKVRNGDW